MLVFNSEMHVLTFIICILEFGMFCYQLVYFLFNPQDKSRGWYMLLLLLLLVYNVAGGLLPNARYGMSVVGQNIIAYGSGFLMSAYFPYYFYKAFNLKSMRFQATYGAFLFLILPYVIFFCIVYPIFGELAIPTSYGMIVPFLYAVFLLYMLLDAIRLKIKKRSISNHPYNKTEMIAVYAAVSPWVFMTVFGYFQISQWIEVLVTNLGFLIITVLFITKSVKVARLEQEKLRLLHRIAPNEEIFESNLTKYDFTAREMEVIRLLRSGCSHQEISEQLFISPSTVAKHVQNIHSKAEVKTRLNLIRKLETP
ncbi:helix-turn-helix transcriptional regulator [Pedobacter sp. Du54]|uniref:response regulator transcription factor n=1 Tax=Pedobacter anseongensis TaxID=3133439 RepID=UPI0030A107F3